ncbi:hypothetical protein BDZ94DRAFT_1249824, partial [Collybia nuda]
MFGDDNGFVHHLKMLLVGTCYWRPTYLIYFHGALPGSFELWIRIAKKKGLG